MFCPSTGRNQPENARVLQESGHRPWAGAESAAPLPAQAAALAASAPVQIPKPDRRPSRRGWLSLVLGLMLALGCTPPQGRSPTRSDSPARQTPSLTAMHADIWRSCRQAMERRLEAPSAAEFAPTADVAFTRVDAITTRARGWVDARDGTGAKLRTSFTCEASLVAEDSWNVRITQSGG